MMVTFNLYFGNFQKLIHQFLYAGLIISIGQDDGLLIRWHSELGLDGGNHKKIANL